MNAKTSGTVGNLNGLRSPNRSETMEESEHGINKVKKS